MERESTDKTITETRDYTILHFNHTEEPVPVPVKRLFVFALGVYRLSTLSKKRDIKAYIMSAADSQCRGGQTNAMPDIEGDVCGE